MTPRPTSPHLASLTSPHLAPSVSGTMGCAASTAAEPVSPIDSIERYTKPESIWAALASGH
eukprot:6756711-Prymnesium_polylepis.1